MRVNFELGVDHAVTQHLDAGVLLDEALRGERVGRHLAVGRVVGETPDVHRDEGLAESVLEAAKLRNAHVERGLTTLEPTGDPRAGARELALRAAARGLPLALRCAATETARQLARAAWLGDLVLAHQPASLASLTWIR